MHLDEVRTLGQPTRLENGQRASALHFGDERVMALLAALSCQVFIPGELANKTLRPRVVQSLNVSVPRPIPVPKCRTFCDGCGSKVW